jgi:ribonuclease P protein component
VTEHPPAASGARFPKASRLLRRPHFSRVFETGLRVQGRFLTILLIPNDTGRPRLGIVASRKLGNAVKRNRAKRLIREAFRRSNSPAGRGLDVVVIPRREIFDAAYSNLEQDFRGALRRGASRLDGAGASRTQGSSGGSGAR